MSATAEHSVRDAISASTPPEKEEDSEASWGSRCQDLSVAGRPLSQAATAGSERVGCLSIQDAGSLKAGLLADNKSKLRQAKQHARELSLAINTTKRQIDALKAAEEAAPSQQVAHILSSTLHRLLQCWSCALSVFDMFMCLRSCSAASRAVMLSNLLRSIMP